ncbi:competence protein CoiA [Methanoculleus sp.]|uniref:competence protein CoiA n=1 Tax=Methanoculleus sp. TaxID=90427 RepID=UPI00272E6279|nr:competence protein CoiA family protein [Methanoculleus sp.]
MVNIPLSAIINGERVIGPDLSDSEWSELRAQHKKGLAVTMPCCGMSGHLRTSKCGLKHFYHAHKSGECEGEPESLDHLRLKNQIYQICRAEGWDAQPEYQSPAGDWRADVYATRGERSVVFEVQLSKIRQEELQEREEKYARDGIESYWLLRDYLDLRPYYEAWGDSEIPLNFQNIDRSDLRLTHEKLYYVQKGIRTIGINSDNRTLCTTKNPSTGLRGWIEYVLNGEYSHYLADFKVQYQRCARLRDSVSPVLDELTELEDKYYYYRRDLKRLYAVFINNTWDDPTTLREEIKLMYASFKRFKDALWKIYSPKNGFIWKTYPHSNYKYRELNLASENQISSIREQVRDLKELEARFSSIFNDLEHYLEHNGRKNQAVVHTIEKEALHKPNKREQEQAIRKPNNKKQEQEDKVDFEFLKVLPALTLVSQRGMKYNNPYGCTWPINKDDAIEFEQKGYGRIVKQD